MKQGCQIFYEGRVQGVGFRATVKQLATGYDVTGSVRNLPDGRVEMNVAADADELEAFLIGIRESVLASHIVREERHPLAVRPAFRGFTISN